VESEGKFNKFQTLTALGVKNSTNLSTKIPENSEKINISKSIKRNLAVVLKALSYMDYQVDLGNSESGRKFNKFSVFAALGVNNSSNISSKIPENSGKINILKSIKRKLASVKEALSYMDNQVSHAD
jgi:hypothetical protein